jgi:hypothetical protein
MPEPRFLSRRQFTIASALAALSGAVITIGCGSDSSPMGNTPPPSADATGAISGNHGHVATITAAQLGAGNTLVLNIQGAATHDHTVQLTAAEIGQVRDRRQVVKTSSDTASHTHTVTFN